MTPEAMHIQVKTIDTSSYITLHLKQQLSCNFSFKLSYCAIFPSYHAAFLGSINLHLKIQIKPHQKTSCFYELRIPFHIDFKLTY